MPWFALVCPRRALVCPGMSQLVAMHDCLFRSRDVAKWTLFLDFDEYLVIPGGHHFAAGEPPAPQCMSHGSYLFSTKQCDSRTPGTPRTTSLPVEMMTHRAATPSASCPGWTARSRALGARATGRSSTTRKVQPGVAAALSGHA